MNRINKLNLALLGSAILASCVDHRPVRNGLLDENIYLDKTNLTRSNPKLGDGAQDDGWLFKVTIVKASSPNVVGDYAFPGLESDTQYIKFRFMENVLQMIDGHQIQADNPNDPNDNLATSTPRVMLEFAGQNVDVKLRESLDGERTNFLEENTEEPWEKRQQFKVDLAKTSLDPIVTFGWFYGDFLHDCARMQSAHLLPGSFEWDDADQHLTFVLEVNYTLAAITNFGGCWDLVSLANGVGTATIQYRFSFYRPAPSTFQPWVIAEKDEANKKYGVFQRLQIFQDPETGLMSAKSVAQRWNPDRAEPVVFYFHEGFPTRFKPMFEEIKAETNQVLGDSGAKLRIDFQEFDDPRGCKIPDHADGEKCPRNFGDLRYSFVVWHEDIEGTRGLLGYGPSASDPRTGETISANLNLYNIGMDWYRFLIQDYLQTNGAAGKPDGMKDVAWEDITCTAGETQTAQRAARLKAPLFEEMRRVMNIPEPEAGADATLSFLPTPARDSFKDDYHRTLKEYRYAEPLYNAYVYQPTAKLPVDNFPDLLKTEKAFQSKMGEILSNQDPFHGLALSSKTGIDAQQQLIADFRTWKKNHDQLSVAQDMMLARRNISVFDANDAISAIGAAARRCTDAGRWESNEEYQERIIAAVVQHVAVHEFGHNLGLRHNFYGSVDGKHMKPGEVSASVMDYVYSPEEAGSPKGWGGYDQAALKWIYGGEDVRQDMLGQDFLYCTDEHRSRSPLCTAHDLGVTPSQIVLNSLERYDWLYEIRNKRAFRTFWDTSTYVDSVYNAIFPMLRMWYLALYDWGGGGVQSVLKRQDQLERGTTLTDPEYDEIAADFYNDIQATIAMIIAFYDAVINQQSSFRNYQTDYDPFYGDVTRIGIIIDKLFTTFAFMDLQEVYNYNPDLYDYVAMYDAPFGDPNKALSQRVLDDMLGANYDTFPWFKYYAIAIFASVTNSNLVGNTDLKERIAIQRFENEVELGEIYGPDVLDQALAPGNISQAFVSGGEEYIYTYLPDQSWHLVAGRSRSPVSFQFLKEYNESLRGSADPDLDNYGLKILLAYYEYYNNFVGF